MKKNLTLLLLCCFFLGFSQEKKIIFNKKLQYKFVEKMQTTDFLMYFSKNNETLTKVEMRGFPMMFFADNLGMSGVNFDMNSRLSDTYLNQYFMGYYDGKTPYEMKITYEKMPTKETIAGISCQNYLLNFKKGDEDYERDDKIQVCIDEKNEINNFPVLLKILDQFSRSKTKSSNLKGLLLKVGSQKDYDKEYAVLKNIKDTQDFVYFDHSKSLMKQQKRTDSLLAEQKKREEEYIADTVTLPADSVYATTEMAYPADSTYIPEPPPPPMISDYDGDYSIPKYESTYKKAVSEEPNLAYIAYNTSESKKILDGLPKHCINLEKNLPSFENKDLKKHLYNYAGQTCDMYLAQSENNNVDKKGTLDEIRREALYLFKIREKLNKTDLKKLDKFLENLD